MRTGVGSEGCDHSCGLVELAEDPDVAPPSQRGLFDEDVVARTDGLQQGVSQAGQVTRSHLGIEIRDLELVLDHVLEDLETWFSFVVQAVVQPSCSERSHAQVDPPDVGH